MARARTLLAPNFRIRGHALIPTAQANRRHHRPLVRKGGEDPPLVSGRFRIREPAGSAGRRMPAIPQPRFLSKPNHLIPHIC